MRTLPGRVLLLTSLFALFTVAASLAQTVQTPPTTEEFLATLAAGQSTVPGTEALPPSPTFLSTVCSSNADCPPDQLCCYPCGIPDCNWVCMTPWRKRCPPIA